MQGSRILLIIGGGIAAYKTPELIRQLKREGIGVTPVLTRAGGEFVSALTLSTLSETEAHQALFDLGRESEIGHIQLSRAADLVVVAPATADLMAKMAAGLADDLASTLLLATDKPVLIAPAMNIRMWEHPATRRNREVLARDGVLSVGPDSGDMACGEFGPGRMAQPEAIVAAIRAALRPVARPLTGRHVIVTSGPTHEPIDPVRYIANRSSGAQGTAIAAASHGCSSAAQLTKPTRTTAQVTAGITTRSTCITAASMSVWARARMSPSRAVVSAPNAETRSNRSNLSWTASANAATCPVTRSAYRPPARATPKPRTAVANSPRLRKSSGRSAAREIRTPAVLANPTADVPATTPVRTGRNHRRARRPSTVLRSAVRAVMAPPPADVQPVPTRPSHAARRDAWRGARRGWPDIAPRHR